MAETAASRHTWFRKALVVPTEHGAWSWLLVPFLVGALVGSLAGQRAPFSGLALIFTLVGGLSAYMSRQPATALARIRRGRGRKADESLALGWTLGFGLVAALCLLGLLALGRTALAALIAPFALVLVMYLLASRSGRAAMRALSMELTGAIGLALMAPAAYIATTDTFDAIAWKLWVLLALQNLLGVLYVRVRLADTHKRPAERRLMLGGHAAALLIVAAGAALAWWSWLMVVPFAGFLLRAGWTYTAPRAVLNVKRFGFTEVGVEITGGLLIVAGFLVSLGL
ncbi:MAG: YwiC-like family protein [Anaerolineae bacterium]|nr:YwiC-like family protein [Anaerolineae bacterium]MCB0205093.1 YwiC-like family protein [Anaerolineae bacterium]